MPASEVQTAPPRQRLAEHLAERRRGGCEQPTRRATMRRQPADPRRRPQLMRPSSGDGGRRRGDTRLMASLTVTQLRSRNGANKKQLDTLRSLGLRRIGHKVEVKDCEQATRDAARRAPPGRGRGGQVSPAEDKEERIGLHNLSPARQPASAQARRSRRRLGHGQDLRPRAEGRGLALGLQAPCALRGWPDADPHADAKAARPAHEEVDALRDVPHAHPAGQHRRTREPLRGRAPR